MVSRCVVVGGFVLGVVTYASAQGNKPDGVELAPIVTVMNEALAEAQSNNIQGFPGLTRAVLELSSTISKQSDGTVRFLVFSIGGSKGTEAGVTLSVAMEPPRTVSAVTPRSFDAVTLKSALAKAINQAKAAFVQANSAGGKLKTTVVEIEVRFGVTKAGSGVLDTGDILPIGFELSRRIAKEETHSIRLTFGE